MISSLIVSPIALFLAAANTGNSCTAGIIPTQCALLLHSIKSDPADLKFINLKDHLAALYIEHKDYKNAVSEYKQLAAIYAAAGSNIEQEVACAYTNKRISETLAFIPEEIWNRKTYGMQSARMFLDIADKLEHTKNYKDAISYTSVAYNIEEKLQQDTEQVKTLIHLSELQTQYARLANKEEAAKLLIESKNNLDRATKIWGQAKYTKQLETMTKELCDLSMNYARTGWTEAAEKILMQAVAKTDKHLSTTDPRFQIVLDYLEKFGVNCYEKSEYKVAERAFNQALVFRKKASGINSHAYAHMLYSLGVCSLHQNDVAKAEKLIRQAFTIFQEVDGIESFDCGLAYFSLGECEEYRQHYRAAKDYLERSLPILRSWQENSPGTFQQALQIYVNVTAELKLTGLSEAAKQELLESISTTKKLTGKKI